MLKREGVGGGVARSNGRGVIMQLKYHATVQLPALNSHCQLLSPPNRKCPFLAHISTLRGKFSSVSGLGAWLRVLLCPPPLYTKLSCLSVLSNWQK